jgi:hypothetical protein
MLPQIDDTHLKEKSLLIAACLGLTKFFVPTGGSTDLRGDTTMVTEVIR